MDVSKARSEGPSHAELLDRNWEAHHDACLNAIRKALVMPMDASVPEMTTEIAKLRAAIEQLLPILDHEAEILKRLPDVQRLGRTNWPMIAEHLRRVVGIKPA